LYSLRIPSICFLNRASSCLAFSRALANCSSVIPSTLACKSNTNRSSSFSSSTVYDGSYSLFNWDKYSLGVKLLVLSIFKNSISSSDKSLSGSSVEGATVDCLNILSCSSLDKSFQSLSSVFPLSPSNLILEESFIPFSFSKVVIISSSPSPLLEGGGVISPPVEGGVCGSSVFGGS